MRSTRERRERLRRPISSLSLYRSETRSQNGRHSAMIAGTMTETPQPPAIRQLSAPELNAMIDSGEPFEFVDVRTEDERAVARIEGSRLLDRAYHDQLLALDRRTPIVFQCHHGIRSQGAAEYFQRAGFTTLFNLRGGIDAWSQLVDPS